ncbi:MAG TPA: adenylyl-sulfate kinase [Actinospica sp.]|jgi:adenylylsulfate kinase|nr:adenylyl-sulfate kinase [Actinospica sp.]
MNVVELDDAAVLLERAVAAPRRPQAPAGPGVTVWLTGLPSAGKSTIAEALAERLRADGLRVEMLDGDAMRAQLSPNLGFSREARDKNVRRIGYVAELLARNGVVVLAPVIAPYAETRNQVRASHEKRGARYLEIHVATPVDVCAERDVKGLYAKQAAGLISGLTGRDDPYEVPKDPDLRIPAHRQSVGESVSILFEYLRSVGVGER